MRHLIDALLATLALLLALVRPMTATADVPASPMPAPRPPPAMAQLAPARDEVDLLLVLAADISRSLDERKFRLQRDGYAAALVNQRVVSAIKSGLTGRIALCFVEWSGAGEQTIIADWTAVGSREDAEAFADRIRTAPRAFMGRTAIGSAIEFGTLQFPRSPFRAERMLIDVSGDGTSNSGVDVVEARQMAMSQRITVNGLAILSEVPLAFNPMHTHPPGGLLAYYENNVIGGPNAFAIAAEGHEAFGTAILAKLLKEIALAR